MLTLEPLGRRPLVLKPRYPRNLHIRTLTTEPILKVHTTPTHHNGHIKVLQLNNSPSRNAISRALLSSLRNEIESLHDEFSGRDKPRTRALVIASAIDESFCAGADLKERAGMSKGETEEFLRTLRSTFALIESLACPTIAAVSSFALGGGLELALSTNFRVFASTATVGLPEVRLGIIPGAGGTYRIRRLLGESKALELALTAQRLSGREAHELGLCNRLVEVDESDVKTPGVSRKAVLDDALVMAGKIAEAAPLASLACLKAIRGDSPQAENDAYASLLSTQDRVRALQAFREKRKPEFQGD